MAKINELTSDVYNLISAGEVVVSPETLLKELIENSIDANAKHISIYVVKGGISEIKVVDDGVGFVKDSGETGKGLGLNSMQYRANQIGAAFVIKQNKPTGTCVQLSISNKLLEVRKWKTK